MKKYLFLVLLSLLLLSSFSTCLANPMYQITPQELQTLEQDLQQLQQNNEQLTKDSITSQKELTQAQDKLKQSQDTLTQLQATLVQLKLDLELTKAHSQTAEQSLAVTSASFDKYVKEVQSETRKLKLERDIGYIGIAYLLFKK